MNTYAKKFRLYQKPSISGQKSSWLKGNTIKEAFIKIIILFLIIISLNIFQNQVRNFFYITSSPISSLFLQSGNGFYKFFNAFSNVTYLKKENMSLEKENQDLLSQIAFLKSSIKENYDLNIALRNVKDDTFKIIATKITGISLVNDVIVIDKGQNQGILENMPLISAEKVIYGRVVKTYKNFSEVALISSKNSVLDVKIQPIDPIKEAIHGVLRGRGNLGVFLDLVSFDSEIKEDDVLVTSGLEGSFPRDLLVGKITSVNKSDLKPFQTAGVQPFLNLKSIENLFIITNYKR